MSNSPAPVSVSDRAERFSPTSSQDGDSWAWTSAFRKRQATARHRPAQRRWKLRIVVLRWRGCLCCVERYRPAPGMTSKITCKSNADREALPGLVGKTSTTSVRMGYNESPCTTRPASKSAASPASRKHTWPSTMALGLVSHMPNGPGVIQDEHIAEIAAAVPPPWPSNRSDWICARASAKMENSTPGSWRHLCARCGRRNLIEDSFVCVALYTTTGPVWQQISLSIPNCWNAPSR